MLEHIDAYLEREAQRANDPEHKRAIERARRALYQNHSGGPSRDDSAPLEAIRLRVEMGVSLAVAVATVVRMLGGTQSDEKRLRKKWTRNYFARSRTVASSDHVQSNQIQIEGRGGSAGTERDLPQISRRA